jgi:hypothetical protein
VLAAAVLRGSHKAADDGDRQRGYLGRNLLHCLSGAGNERSFFKQIGGRIAADCELREDRQFGAAGRRPAGEIHDLCGVAVEVPDRRIDLCQRDLH